MICGTMTLPYLFRIHLFGVGAKVEDSIISGLVTRQGGYNYVGIRSNVGISFPVAYSTVLSIVGIPVVNKTNSSGRGLENIKTYNPTSFVYYSGFDIDGKNLLWLSVGI